MINFLRPMLSLITAATLGSIGECEFSLDSTAVDGLRAEVGQSVEALFGRDKFDPLPNEVLVAHITARIVTLPAKQRTIYLATLRNVEIRERLKRGRARAMFHPVRRRVYMTARDLVSFEGRVILAHELTHLEQTFRSPRFITPAIRWDHTLFIETEAFGAEYDYLQKVFAADPNYAQIYRGHSRFGSHHTRESYVAQIYNFDYPRQNAIGNAMRLWMMGHMVLMIPLGWFIFHQ